MSTAQTAYRTLYAVTPPDRLTPEYRMSRRVGLLHLVKCGTHQTLCGRDATGWDLPLRGLEHSSDQPEAAWCTNCYRKSTAEERSEVRE